LVLTEAADLQQELAVLGELQEVGVLVAVAADPDVALIVDVDAVVRLRPLVALAWSAPRAHEIAIGVELQHRRRLFAAVRARWRALRAFSVVVPGGGPAVYDPDVILLIGPHADRVAEQARERFWPERIDFEDRRLHHIALRLGRVLQNHLTQAESG